MSGPEDLVELRAEVRRMRHQLGAAQMRAADAASIASTGRMRRRGEEVRLRGELIDALAEKLRLEEEIRALIREARSEAGGATQAGGAGPDVPLRSAQAG